MLRIQDLLNNKEHIPQLKPDTKNPSQKNTGKTQPERDPDNPKSRNSTSYSIEDDLSILKAISLYYGPNFSGNVPWSFWQVYKRMTGSKRSMSSLYHHWAGAISRKYEGFLKQGKLTEFILWLEMAVSAGATKNSQSMSSPSLSRALKHQKSQPPQPLEAQPVLAPLPLRRNPSYQGDPFCTKKKFEGTE